MGRVPEAVAETTECPPELRYLWEHFARLCSKRESDGMGGVSPIRYRDMLDYCRARRVPCFEGWEVEVLDRLDGVWIGVRNQKQKQAATAKVRSNG